MDFVTNQSAGNTFENLFALQCKLSGLWAERNEIRARRGWKGRLQELKSNLDFTVIRRDGRVAFVDCKNFERGHFTHSDLPDHQRALAARYNEHQVPAGFVVWFRLQNAVVFFQGSFVEARGRGSRFCPSDGLHLGSWGKFDPGGIFDFPMGSPSGIVR